jgi:hypothetical protein
MEIINGETARRQSLEKLNKGQKANIDAKYNGNLELAKKDFATKVEYYEQSIDNFEKSSKALEKSIATEAKIQASIDDFKATDPTNFNLANNLTFKDNKGNVQKIDINVNSGEASSFGGAVTKAGFDKFGNILLITTTLDFGDIKPVSNVLAHEAGHAYNIAKNPAKAMLDKTTLNCKDPANRNSFQSKTAWDWEDSYDMLKALQTKK